MAVEQGDFASLFEELESNVNRFIFGQRRVVRLALVCLLAGGHLLLEDRPGTGKTSLARTIARSIDATMGRIQFTSDLLPADITGSVVLNPVDNSIEFRPGPVFRHIILADEINRASPKTQSALLEAMEERQVTADGVTYPMDPPFVVIATQNPVGMEGTYRLPESQLDRFMMRTDLGYPNTSDEVAIVVERAAGRTVDGAQAVLSIAEVNGMIEYVQTVFVDDSVYEYAVKVVDATRDEERALKLPASPRASIDLVKAGRAFAATSGRDYVTADDIKRLAPFVLCHRIQVGAAASLKRTTAADVINGLLDEVRPPGQRSAI